MESRDNTNVEKRMLFIGSIDRVLVALDVSYAFVACSGDGKRASIALLSFGDNITALVGSIDECKGQGCH